MSVLTTNDTDFSEMMDELIKEFERRYAELIIDECEQV